MIDPLLDGVTNHTPDTEIGLGGNLDAGIALVGGNQSDHSGILE